jgi:hypothetical protein
LVLIFCCSFFLQPSVLAAQEAPAASIDPFQLALVLKAAREYCRLLERAALNFVCVEEVSEIIDTSRDGRRDAVERLPTPAVVSGEINTGSSRFGGRGDIKFSSKLPNKHKNTYLYDYQLTRKGGTIKESRVLLEKNHKKASAREAPPQTGALQYADILLAPIQLLDERFQEFYSYRLLREDMLNGENVWLLEVMPRISAGDRYLGGTIVLRQKDFRILRINWDPTTFGGYENILRTAGTYKAKPQVVSYTEFGYEKNGVQFPSVDETEEAYLGKDNTVFVRAWTRIAYKEYKFFTVETETVVRK